MDSYLAGQVVTRTIELLDDQGSPIEASAASYRVLDEAGTVLVASTEIADFTAGGSSAEVIVAAEHNALAGEAVRALRVVELTLVTTGGTRILEDNYVITLLDPLSYPANSFQTLKQAELLAAEIPNLEAWASATRAEKVAALLQARLNLFGLRYRWSWVDYQSRVDPWLWTNITDLSELTDSEWGNLDAEFLVALRRAQVIEANDLLGGDPYERKRREGLLSETVGESSVMFRPGTPPRQAACATAMRALAKYLAPRTIGLTRT